MIESLEKQPRIKFLPAVNTDRKHGLKERDINSIARIVEDSLPPYVKDNVDVTVTLLEKNLMVMADVVLMEEALMHLIKNSMEIIPNGGKLSLSASQVNFEIESLLDYNDYMIGACALVSLVGTGAGIDDKIKEKIFEPFFTIKSGDIKGLGLPIAYRIFEQHPGSIKVKSQAGQGTEVNLYLPLTIQEIVSIVLIPLSASYGRQSLYGGRLAGKLNQN